MPRFRLRYQSTDLEMPLGDFVIGRSTACSLAVDDGLVSRQHAVMHVSEDGVVLEDLGSRNGVHVNGDRVQGKRKLANGDRVVIGSQEMVLIELVDIGRGSRRQTTEQRICPACSTPITETDRHCPTCGAPLVGHRPTLAGTTIEMKVPLADGKQPDEPTRAADAFHMMVLIADKALALNRFEEAERMLGRQLEAMIAKAKNGRIPPEEDLQLATRYALRLAEALKRTRWLDWVFEAWRECGMLLPATVIDQLHEVVRKTRYADGRALRSYLEAFRPRATSLSPGDRFLLKRIEGLERVITA